MLWPSLCREFQTRSPFDLFTTHFIQEDIMKKREFITYISEKHTTTKAEAEKVIDMFTSSVMCALGEGNEVSLIGFGKFSVSKVSAKAGRNPFTGADVRIPAYNQVNGTANRLKVVLFFLKASILHVLPHPAWKRNIDQAY